MTGQNLGRLRLQNGSIPEKLWVKFENRDADEVTTVGCQIFDDFKLAVKAVMANTFTNSAAARPGHSIEEAFYNDEAKSWFGISGREPLIAKVIQTRVSMVTGTMMFSRQSDAIDSFNEYQNTAKRLLGDMPTKEVNELIDSVCVEKNLPFIFIEGSSGCGKTQLAMILLFQSFQKDAKRIVYYLLSTKRTSNSQLIYQFFPHPSTLFVSCYKEDMKSRIGSTRVDLRAQDLYTFGFIEKLLFGEVYGKSEDVQIQRMREHDLKTKIENKWNDIKRRPLIILDEFHTMDPEKRGFVIREEELSF
ncbi:hypothetical protein MP638_007557, partial [Amoeboaphelidium occidentale]